LWLTEQVNVCVLEKRNCSGKAVDGNLSSTCLFAIYLMTISVTQIMCEGCPENFAALSTLQSELKALFFMFTEALQSIMFSRAYVDTP